MRSYTLRLAILLAVFTTTCPVPSATGQTLAWRVEYDGQGRIARQVDPAGRVTQYAYTPASGAPVQSVIVTPPEGAPVTWRFNDDGQLASMSDSEGEEVYRYDNRGRLAAVERKGAPAVRYGYDAAGRIAELRVGDFYRIAWTYDFLGRISSLDTPAGRIRYEYQSGQGVVIRSLPNGVKTIWKRQADGELEEITHGFFKKPDDNKYTVLAQYSYEYGPDGRITAIRERSGQGEFARRYSYDTMGRLVSATGPEGQVYGYAYDLVGNRIKATVTGRPDQTYTYDWAGRLTSVDGNPCAYDASGNLTDITLDGVGRQYRYDPGGRLAEAKVGGDAVQYGYDGFGRLVVRKTASSEIRFTPDSLSLYWQPLIIEEVGGERTLVIWDGSTPLALISGGKVEWLLHDHLGSVRIATDGLGRVLYQMDHNPFGALTRIGSQERLVPGFAGLFGDIKTGIFITIARHYSPELGTFLQTDPQQRVPFGSPKDGSIYAYCGGDPVNYLDHDGSEAVPYDTVAFNSIIRWWDSYLRALDYHTFGWFRNAIGRSDAKPVFNTDPEIRDSVVKHILDLAWLESKETDELDRTLKDWRRDPGTRPKALQGKWITDQEWQAAENYTTARFEVDRADKTLGLGVVGRAAGSAWTAGLAGGWLAWKNFASAAGIPPPKISKDDNRWIPTTLGTLKWQAKGIIDAWSSPQALPQIKSVWEQIDDFFCPPAYGDEVLEGAYPDFGGFGLLEGVLASTTGPGKRGGRGGGITRPPSWPRPPGPQGNPPPGPQPKPGGTPPPGGGGRSSTGYSPLTPSTVGGVYLGGAGAVLNGLGVLRGVRTDANGNLVLIGEEGEDIKLPALRLDDVVTVFRSVYIHGEGPMVTIDPNPKDPDNSAMIIRHGKATEDTYVGWVLYQADRLMKGYGQGVDNITAKDVMSSVPGYADVVDEIYFGADDPRKSQKEGIWERFWIVPAEARRFESPHRELTLFHVPLKVKTQKMKWENGKLVDDLTGQSSPGATAFTKWFTANYSAIAAEQYLTPPLESGITTAVPVFEELRRITLITAVAEKLRDQGVAMPFWMYDYEVRKVPFEKFTPGMEVTRKQAKGGMLQTSRLFGGVRLSADDKSVKTYATASDAAQAPPEVRAEVDRSIKLADRLERVVADRFTPANAVPLTVQRIEDENREFRAVSVPGSDTLMLGPCRLDEVDLIVPIAAGGDIRLARSFNSFFNPKGPWGQGWTLDLPRLVEIRVPLDREEGKSSYITGYELVTPLNSLRAHLLNGRPVLGFSNPKSPAADQNSPFQGMAEDRPAFFKEATTLVLLLKNGQQWHFTPRGDMVAIKEGPLVTAYERGTEGQITRIVGLLGGQIAGEIKLEYSSDGILEKALGTSFEDRQSRPVEVTYAYDNAGRLSGVASEQGLMGYGYQGSWVNTVTWQDKTGSRQPEVLRSFEYNGQGQVLSEKDGKTSIMHTISPTPEGVTVSSRADSGEAREDGLLTAVMEYDPRLRLTKSIAANGTRTHWSYPATGGVEMTVTSPDQPSVKVVDSPDGRQRTIEQSGAPRIVALFDGGGRLTNVSEDGRPVLRQEWRPDGQPAYAETAAQGASLRYDAQGMLTSIALHPAKAGERLSEWQETKLDRRGRPIEITDYSGLRIQIGYDDSGALTAAVQRAPDGKGNYGYHVKRDEQGRIRAVNSSWGDWAYSYDKEGSIQSVEASRGNRSSTIELSAGRVRTMTGFDNGRTAFEYHQDGPFAGMPLSIVCPNGLKLEYEYDAAGNLAAVKVGAERRVRLGYDSQGRLNVYAWEAVPR